MRSLRLSGGTLAAATHANGLAARGHQVTVVTQRDERPSFRTLAKSLIKTRRLPKAAPTIETFFKNVDVRPASREDIAGGRVFPDADFVMGCWWETIEWIMPLPSSRGRKFHFVQDLELFDYLPHQRTLNVLNQPIPKITVSRWLAEEVGARFSPPAVYSVLNGVDLELFRARDRRKAQIPTIGFLYSSVPRKNVGLAVSSLEKVRKSLPSLRAIAFGALQYDLPEWIEFNSNPPRSTIPDLYSRCDAWLFSSSSEGFGLPILESLACGTPVIATRAGAAPDLITPENGVLVDATPDSMAAAIVRMARMPPDEWSTMSRVARSTAEQHSWEKATERMEQVFLDALNT